MARDPSQKNGKATETVVKNVLFPLLGWKEETGAGTGRDSIAVTAEGKRVLVQIAAANGRGTFQSDRARGLPLKVLAEDAPRVSADIAAVIFVGAGYAAAKAGMQAAAAYLRERQLPGEPELRIILWNANLEEL
jgi:hypothetical protein